MNYKCNLTQDTIPKLKNIYAYNPYESGKQYQSYQSIKGGYINYFPKKRPIEQVYSRPVFTNIIEVKAYKFQDPMGNIKPYYDAIHDHQPKTVQLSFINDTSNQREEIIALQMRKINSVLYENKW
jgi:hypothetical protein